MLTRGAISLTRGTISGRKLKRAEKRRKRLADKPLPKEGRHWQQWDHGLRLRSLTLWTGLLVGHFADTIFDLGIWPTTGMLVPDIALDMVVGAVANIWLALSYAPRYEIMVLAPYRGRRWSNDIGLECNRLRALSEVNGGRAWR